MKRRNRAKQLVNKLCDTIRKDDLPLSPRNISPCYNNRFWDFWGVEFETDRSYPRGTSRRLQKLLCNELGLSLNEIRVSARRASRKGLLVRVVRVELDMSSIQNRALSD